MTDPADQADGIAWADKSGSSGPNVARIYDYLLGGKDHFAADRQAAQRLIAALPDAAAVARANRAFLAAAVRHAAREGIAQYLDIGAGLPTSPSVHECARAIVPGARVAYVDNDPVAVRHAQALLAAGDGVIAIEGDAREPEAILAGPALAGVIDLAEPVCLLLVSMLHFVTAAEADMIVGTFRQRMVPGSYLIISQGNASPVPREPVQNAYGSDITLTGAPRCRDRRLLRRLRPGATRTGARRRMASRSAGRADATTPAGAAHLAAGEHAGRRGTKADLNPRGQGLPAVTASITSSGRRTARSRTGQRPARRSPMAKVCPPQEPVTRRGLSAAASAGPLSLE